MANVPRIISVLNQKGGVAKTTTTANLGSCLAAQGYRTLLIDMDPQANLTLGAGARVSAGRVGLHDVLLRKAGVRLEHILVGTEGLPLSVVPASFELAHAEAVLTPMAGSCNRLKQALEPYQDFSDFILIDCPPSLGRLTEMAVVASSHLLIPTEPKLYSFAGMDTLNRMIANLREDLDLDVRLLGVLLTMVEQRTKLHRMIGDEIREQFGEHMFETVIRRTVRVSEAEIEGKAAILLDPTSTAAQDYKTVTEEVLRRLSADTITRKAAENGHREQRRSTIPHYPLITTPPDVMVEPEHIYALSAVAPVHEHAPMGASIADVPLRIVPEEPRMAFEAVREVIEHAESPAEVVTNEKPAFADRLGGYLSEFTRKLSRRR